MAPSPATDPSKHVTKAAPLTLRDADRYRSAFDGNSARHGGGIANHGTLTVTDSTFSGNLNTGSRHSGSGAGIYNEGVAVAVNNSAFSGNSNRGFGGGI
jgi:predicted outer membrane repeat protein